MFESTSTHALLRSISHTSPMLVPCTRKGFMASLNSAMARTLPASLLLLLCSPPSWLLLLPPAGRRSSDVASPNIESLTCGVVRHEAHLPVTKLQDNVRQEIHVPCCASAAVFATVAAKSSSAPTTTLRAITDLGCSTATRLILLAVHLPQLLRLPAVPWQLLLLAVSELQTS